MELAIGRHLISVLASLLLALPPATSAAEGPQLEQAPWPQPPNACEACVTMQYGRLEIQLPLAIVGRILVLGGTSSSGMHILPPDYKVPERALSVIFFTQRESTFEAYKRHGFFRQHGVKTNRDFFDALGKSPDKSKSLTIMRKAHLIDRAKRYSKASKGALSAYWVQMDPPQPSNSDNVYFVIDGEKDVYVLSGHITRALYEAVLSRMSVVDVP
jgi:hypothetical protein